MLRSPTTRLRSRMEQAVIIAGLTVAVAMLALPAIALAGKPTGEYAVFSHCPLSTTGVNECAYIQTSSGELQLGSKMTIPIENVITLQGGIVVKEKEETWVNPTEGGALSRTPEKVPGGFDSSPLTATMELVGAVAISRSDLEAGKGAALKLPVRMRLTNMFLTEECYVGSSASPITLDLTTGTTSPPEPNKPIHGSAGERQSKEEGNLVIFDKDSLVENAFPVPTVTSSCGSGAYREIIPELLDAYFNLPSSSGHNTAVLDGTSKLASAEAVRKSE